MAETMTKIDAVEIPFIEIPEAERPEELSPENIIDGEKENIQEIMDEYLEDKKVEINDENLEDVDIDGVSEWWDAWCEIREIIDDAFEANVEGGNSATLTEDEQYDHMSVRNEFINFSIDVYAGGDLSYITEYAIDIESNAWGMLYEGFPDVDGLDQIQLGREVARAELAIIINTTKSAAETIDYWQTKLDPIGWNQKNWADIRGVSRQTVNDRVRSAVDSLDN
ncbi:hypothetical protein [Halobacterium salinarum]|uniref:hypothetical protein n=1 Tax=Halobacterium salinarum TaxID=2242 RepID=UPI0025566D5F|nr:hypothetical protein [Halobacterium salinarum]